MTLKPVILDYESVETPPTISAFLKSTEEVVEKHRVNTAISFRGFVPSDYVKVYRSLKSLYDSELICSTRFCEWGSGVGVVTSLAAMIGYDSYGIEYDAKLCSVAEGIRENLDIPYEIINGSFVPANVEDLIDEEFSINDGDLSLHTESDDAYAEMGYAIDDFDLVFAYPWPNDCELVHSIFDRFASQGALLLAYNGGDALTLFRKS